MFSNAVKFALQYRENRRSGQGLGNCSSQRGLAVVNVADGADVHMRLSTLELLLSHYSSLLVGMHKFALVDEFVNDK